MYIHIKVGLLDMNKFVVKTFIQIMSRKTQKNNNKLFCALLHELPLLWTRSGLQRNLTVNHFSYKELSLWKSSYNVFLKLICIHKSSFTEWFQDLLHRTNRSLNVVPSCVRELFFLNWSVCDIVKLSDWKAFVILGLLLYLP